MKNKNKLTFIHRDKDGNIIQDMSKVTLSQKLSDEIFELLNPKHRVN